MRTPTSQIPRQRIPLNEKDQEWKEDTIDSIIDLCSFEPPFERATRERMHKAYKFYNGVVDDEDYTHVLQPYGKKRENFPAKLHNYNIIKPNIDLLKGEKDRRPLNFTVKVNNPDVTNRKLQEKREALKQNLIDHFMVELQKQGVDVRDLAPDQQPDPPEHLEEIFDREYRDDRAIRGQKAINYIVDDVELDRKFQEGWFHWLVAGEVITSRNVGMNQLRYEVLNPLQVDYDKSPDSTYIEDGQWAVHRRLSSVNDVLDAFYEELTPKEIKQLENPNRDYDPFVIYSDEPNVHDDDGRLIEVMEVYWKSMTRVGILSYMDQQGLMQQTMVRDGYEVGENEQVQWFWITQVWQGFRIDGDIYKRVGPMDIQRRDLDNISKAKLPINGRRYSDVNAPNISLAMMGIPYQISYNIYKYRLENAIAKSKGVLAQFDINMIPDDWEIDDFMYYAEATSIAWTEYEDGDVSPQHQSVLDLTVKVIEDFVTLLQSIKHEWEQLSGVTRQRKGQITPYETKGGSEHAIVQSSYITEDYFTKYRHFEERELSALLDYSKILWITGESMSYVTPEGATEILQIDGIEHMESEYGVRVSNSKEDIESVNQLKDLSQAMLQNGVSLSNVIEVMEANSLSGIKDKIRDAERRMQELQQAQAQAEQQAQQAQAQAEQAKIEADLEKERMQQETKIKLKQMELEQDDEELEQEEEENEKDRQLERELARMKNGQSN